MIERIAQVLPASYGAVTASSVGTSVTSGSGAGTFSSAWVELCSSLDVDAKGFWLHAQNSGGYLFQARLGVGAAASEAEICTVFFAFPANHAGNIFVPIAVAAGSRISAKVADDGGSSATRLHISPVRGSGPAPLVSTGWVVGLTSGVPPDVDCGGTPNTKSGWVELTSSSHATRDAKGFSIANVWDASCDTSNAQLWDIAIGAAASEQVIFANHTGTQEGYRAQNEPKMTGPIWTPIPAGSRIAVRAQSTTNAASSRVPRMALILWG